MNIKMWKEYNLVRKEIPGILQDTEIQIYTWVESDVLQIFQNSLVAEMKLSGGLEQNHGVVPLRELSLKSVCRVLDLRKFQLQWSNSSLWQE